MKVESHRDILTPTDLGRVDADRSTPSGSRPSTPGQVTDQVSLSGAVQFAQAAERAANEAPAVRPDKVAQAKALLANGQVGTDLDSLASSIIDSLIKCTE
jgi:flagellar biosynthesis anti-sigma factor FlgM